MLSSTEYVRNRDSIRNERVLLSAEEGISIAARDTSPMSPILVVGIDPKYVVVCVCEIFVANTGPKGAIVLDRQDLFTAVFHVSSARNVAPFTHRNDLVGYILF